MKEPKNSKITTHPVIDGEVTINREERHYMPKGYEYILVFQQTLEHVLSYDLNKTELKVFVFVLSQVGFENNLVMPGLQELCAKRTGTHQPHVSAALKQLEKLNIIVKEKITDTKSFRYRINYSIAAKTKGYLIKEKFEEDKKNNPLQTTLFDEKTA